MIRQARWMFVGKAADPLELVMLEQCYELEVGEIIRAERVQMIFLDTPLPIPTTDYFCRQVICGLFFSLFLVAD